MNDDALLQSLAEREGVFEEDVIRVIGGYHFANATLINGDLNSPGYCWNPLEHWADCGHLIEKHRISVYWEDGEWWAEGVDASYAVGDPDPKRAICLAVAEMG